LKVLIAHPGTQYSFQLAKQLEKLGLLYRFYTGIAISHDSVKAKMLRLLPASMYKKFSNRIIENIPSGKLKTQPILEYQTILSMRNVVNPEDLIYKRNLKFQHAIPDSAILESDVVIGFDTSSWILAERCKKLGRKFILDVSIGHPISKEKIYSELSESYPEWKEQIVPKKKEFIDLECKEMELADMIIVPSEFVKQTLVENGVLPGKIEVNPFGTVVEEFRFTNRKSSKDGKIVFLFLGSFSARKGLPLLLDTWREMNIPNAKLLIAGYGKIPEGIQLPENVVNKGVIAKDERQALFDSADVFLFPSFFEGLAQVQIEAMACGLPVVGTRNSGANELVNDGVNGFIIEAGNKKQLKDTIEYFIQHPGRSIEMGVLAKKKVEQFSWDTYGKRCNALILK
jgi:glycosyltransferase involved in cell wall biosynthesis